MAEWEVEVDRFCHQYFQLESDLAYPSASILKLAACQDAIYSRLFAESTVCYSPPPRYQVRILKNLVSQIEASIDDWDKYEVSDDLVSVLSRLLASNLPSEMAAAHRKSHVTYHISALSGATQNCHVTLLENRYLIAAGGTTGLRTWEAALHLGHYLCHNVGLVRGKRVLELGAGTGFLSILCARHLGAAHVIASDGADEVVYSLPENFFLNDLQGSGSIAPMDVKWGWPLLGTEDEKWNGGSPVDVVLGADITYDASVIPALIATVTDLFRLHPLVEMFVAATQRNEETFKVFLEQCKVNQLCLETLNFRVPPKDEQRGPFYSDKVEIKICKLLKR